MQAQRTHRPRGKKNDSNAALPESPYNYRTVFESVPDLYLLLTPDLRIVAASHSYLAAMRQVRDEVLAQRMFDVFPDNPNLLRPDGVQASIHEVLRPAAPH